MVIRIGYEVNGVTRADSRLKGLDLGSRDLTLGFYSVQGELQRQEAEQFASEGAYGSGGWPPLSEDYRLWKERKRPGVPILQFDGDLYRSLTQDSAPGAIREITPLSLTFGTSIPYAKYHQEGTPRMPARPPLILLSHVRGRATRILRETIEVQMHMEGMRAGGGSPVVNPVGAEAAT